MKIFMREQSLPPSRLDETDGFGDRKRVVRWDDDWTGPSPGDTTADELDVGGAKYFQPP
ncbi:MAG: hypothetical protein KGL35_22290 [Bradyrhizobium sp.]|nr:hypothetical protein [Pseudomonadota bacterium]MDE2067511.1 hypothetical protein [Bradyrhizobium sp.]MDE2471384.1 hypothetical protein [Bradyrhizobium sp.]